VPAERGGRSTSSTKLELQPADPVDLIRWLARTQNDPRKAVAELVQSSIDARDVRIERRRVKGPGGGEVLEQLVAVIAHAERNRSAARQSAW
jgi:hypothetical protein